VGLEGKKGQVDFHWIGIFGFLTTKFRGPKKTKGGGPNGGKIKFLQGRYLGKFFKPRFLRTTAEGLWKTGSKDLEEGQFYKTGGVFRGNFKTRGKTNLPGEEPTFKQRGQKKIWCF